jgi:hypothetical protein
MPKKKAAAKAVKKVARTMAKTTKAVKKAKKTTRPVKKQPMTRKAAVPAKPVAPVPASPQVDTLGRPLVTQEEKLYMLFHDDYQCRQVFEFLRVETVKELEQFTPHQIVHLMSRPIRLTVDRIRQRLAQFKRSLKDDEQFAADFRAGSGVAGGSR